MFCIVVDTDSEASDSELSDVGSMDSAIENEQEKNYDRSASDSVVFTYSTLLLLLLTCYCLYVIVYMQSCVQRGFS